MSENNPIYDDDIDLFELFQDLWNRKWSIIAITFITALFGITYCLFSPNSYQVSTPIQSADNNVFVKYNSLNYMIRETEKQLEMKVNIVDLTGSGSSFLTNITFDSRSVFEMFITEFNNYQSMINVLSKDEYVKQSIKDLDEIGKKRALISYAKLFKLEQVKQLKPSSTDESWLLSFVWVDPTRGTRLLNDAIEQILLKIQEMAKIKYDELASVIDVINSRTLESLSHEISLLKKNQIALDTKRIYYLKEQSSIAKELGIEANRLDGNALRQTTQNAISVNVNSIDVPYYLRGTTAINKELEIMETRTMEASLLMTGNYISINEEIIRLANDLTSKQIRRLSNMIEKDNPNNWLNYNLLLADIKTQKSNKVIVLLSIILGGMLGVMYVLISNATRRHIYKVRKT